MMAKPQVVLGVDFSNLADNIEQIIRMVTAGDRIPGWHSAIRRHAPSETPVYAPSTFILMNVTRFRLEKFFAFDQEGRNPASTCEYIALFQWSEE
ncbi:MAG: hypothetical protein LBO79_06970 [Zoogloeaceae bacterium]|nr:hypothetical protein [Zoogloeaceae bacterium]